MLPRRPQQKHWNSFTTGFLRPLDDVAAELSRTGRVEVVDAAAADALLKAPLRCHRCGGAQGTMPGLKAHLERCGALLL